MVNDELLTANSPPSPPPLVNELVDEFVEAPVEAGATHVALLLLVFFFPTIPPTTPPTTAAMKVVATMTTMTFPLVVERKVLLSGIFSRDALASKSASCDREVDLARGVDFPAPLVS